MQACKVGVFAANTKRVRNLGFELVGYLAGSCGLLWQGSYFQEAGKGNQEALAKTHVAGRVLLNGTAGTLEMRKKRNMCQILSDYLFSVG